VKTFFAAVLGTLCIAATLAMLYFGVVFIFNGGQDIWHGLTGDPLSGLLIITGFAKIIDTIIGVYAVSFLIVIGIIGAADLLGFDYPP
jgi:hypothetical protein